MDNMTFNYSDIPYHWALCFNDNCTRKEECLRYQAAQVTADEQAEENHKAMCVTPLAWRNGTCSCFTAIRTERFAWGFDHIGYVCIWLVTVCKNHIIYFRFLYF